MELQEKKQYLIDSLIHEGVLKTKEVIEAFKKVKRENFVLPKYKDYAYVDEPLPIMKGQTISQPYTVAAMTEALQPKKGHKILEIGAGSGYQAAILAEIVRSRGRVITVERIKELADFAKKNLRRRRNVVVINSDGTEGWGKKAPYDRIIVTASALDIPVPLIEQLKIVGRMVIPIIDEMYVVEKISGTRIRKELIGHYSFVPLIGKHGHKE